MGGGGEEEERMKRRLWKENRKSLANGVVGKSLIIASTSKVVVS